MKTRRPVIIVTAVVIALALVACQKQGPGQQQAAKADSGTVVARIGSEVITLEQFEEYLNSQNPLVRSRYSSLDQKKRLLQSLVEREAMVQEAKRLKLDQDPQVQLGLKKILARHLVNKVFNASRFVLMQLERAGESLPGVDEISQPLDLALVDRLRTTIAQATTAFEGFDYATALQVAEDGFWNFCDHYLELVKLRSYSEEDTPERRSAMAALSWGLKTFLRLLAPFLPFVTEEVWSWVFAAEEGRERSIHTAAWPAVDEVDGVPRPDRDGAYDAAIELLAAIRGAKTTAQKSLRWPVARLEILGPEDYRNALDLVLDDVLRAGHVDPEAVTVSDGPSPEGSSFTVTVELAEEQPE